jgi:hypothetical protein
MVVMCNTQVRQEVREQARGEACSSAAVAAAICFLNPLTRLTIVSTTEANAPFRMASKLPRATKYNPPFVPKNHTLNPHSGSAIFSAQTPSRTNATRTSAPPPPAVRPTSSSAALSSGKFKTKPLYFTTHFPFAGPSPGPARAAACSSGSGTPWGAWSPCHTCCRATRARCLPSLFFRSFLVLFCVSHHPSGARHRLQPLFPQRHSHGLG